MNWQDYIHKNNAIMFGKPVIKETRLRNGLKIK